MKYHCSSNKLFSRKGIGTLFAHLKGGGGRRQGAEIERKSVEEEDVMTANYDEYHRERKIVVKILKALKLT